MSAQKQTSPKPEPTAKKISTAQAFKKWMSGTGRSELAKLTGLTRGALRRAFMKASGKSWLELDIESGRVPAGRASAKAKGKKSSKSAAKSKAEPTTKEGHTNAARRKAA